MTLFASTLDPAVALKDIRDEWQALFERVEGAAWSYAPAVFEHWRNVLRAKQQDRLIVVRDESGALRGLFPLTRELAWRGPSLVPRFDYDPNDRDFIRQKRLRPFPVRQASVMSSLPGTMLWLSPLCHPHDHAAVCEAVSQKVLDIGGWDVGVFPVYEGLDEADMARGFEKTTALVRKQTLGREVQNLKTLAPFDHVVSRQPKKFRQNVRRARRVAEETGITFRFADDPADLPAAFAYVADIAQRSWKHEGRDGKSVHIPYDGPQQAFFESLLSADDLKGRAAIGFADSPDGPIASLILLHMARTVTALLTFWDGSHQKASPGLLLIGAGMDWAVAQGAGRFDYNSTAPWVRYLADSTDAVCNLVVFRNSLRGRLMGRVAEARGVFR